MLDTRVRTALQPTLHRAGIALASRGVTAGQLTAAGWTLGAGASVAVALAQWHLALLLWLGNRLFDGLDGAVARVQGPTDRGAFLDIVADFSVYAGFVVGVAVAVPDARLACTVLLAAYYLSGSAFLALSSLLERRRHHYGDERSLRFVGGLAEGTETVLVYAAITLFPSAATGIAWAFAVAVTVTAGQRLLLALHLLRRPSTATAPGLSSTVTDPRLRPIPARSLP